VGADPNGPRVERDGVEEAAMLDLFYLAIGILGFLALWGITKACDRA
jgi:hypothetical protein